MLSLTIFNIDCAISVKRVFGGFHLIMSLLLLLGFLVIINRVYFGWNSFTRVLLDFPFTFLTSDVTTPMEFTKTPVHDFSLPCFVPSTTAH